MFAFDALWKDQFNMSVLKYFMIAVLFHCSRNKEFKKFHASIFLLFISSNLSFLSYILFRKLFSSI